MKHHPRTASQLVQLLVEQIDNEYANRAQLSVAATALLNHEPTPSDEVWLWVILAWCEGNTAKAYDFLTSAHGAAAHIGLDEALATIGWLLQRYCDYSQAPQQAAPTACLAANRLPAGTRSHLKLVK
jgi:hypothetical protein